MLFSDRPRSHYPNAPIHEVICQLRFPTILTINTVEPADFQEAIREDFPPVRPAAGCDAAQGLRPGRTQPQGGAAASCGELPLSLRRR